MGRETTTFRRPLILVFTAMLVIAATSCENEELGSLFDPDYVNTRPTPTITSIDPAGGAQAAVDTVIITGTNFSSAPANNAVYFNTSKGTVIEATTTQLKVLPPLVVGDSVSVKLRVDGAELFSNSLPYKLEAAIVEVEGFFPSEGSGGMATDEAGNLFVALTVEGVDQGIERMTPTGTRSTYLPKTTGVAQWASLKLGPGGYMFLARNFRAISRVAPGGATIELLWRTLTAGHLMIDLDFDQNNNLWAVGSSPAIYMIRQNATFRQFPYVATLRGARVYNGNLYTTGRKDNINGVWRAPILGDSLGTAELYFDFASSPLTSTKTPLAMTLASDGTIFIGTEAPEGIIVLSPSKAVSTPYKAYSLLTSPSCLSFAWGEGEVLYAGRGTAPPIKIFTRKLSAPYYGQ